MGRLMCRLVGHMWRDAWWQGDLLGPKDQECWRCGKIKWVA